MISQRKTAPRFITIVIIAALLALLVVCFHYPSVRSISDRTNTQPVSWLAPDYIDPARAALRSENSHPSFEGKEAMIQIGVTSHHLPTAATFIAAFYRTLGASAGPRSTFVIVGPDHFERCATTASTTRRPYRTAFGTLQSDEEIVQALQAAGAGTDDACFEREHAIGAQVPFIASLFPGAKIVPLALSSATSGASIERIANTLTAFEGRIAVVASVDFSHYKHADEARRMDSETEAMILSGNASALTIRSVDSPPSLRLALALAKKFGQTKAMIIGRANSADFTGIATNTTGYRNIVFVRPW